MKSSAQRVARITSLSGLLFFVGIPASLGAQGGGSPLPMQPGMRLPGDAGARALVVQFEKLLRDEALTGARLGFALRDLESGKTIDASGGAGGGGFITASNMKLISSAVALETLGPDFRFVTKLVGVGEQKGEVFEGDLVLVGSGDPTLGATYFEKEGATAPFRRMAAALQKLGIREVRGRILGDDDVHAEEIMGRGWDWSYHADWYAAQIGGLCFNENCIDVVLDVGASGPPRIRLEPDTAYVTIVNELKAASGDDKARGVHWQRRLGGNRIVLSGSLKRGTKAKRDWGSVHNPTAYAATVLRETLIGSGLRVRGGAYDLDEVLDERRVRAADGRELAQHRSPPMHSIVRALNKRSQNVYAEQLVRAAARKGGRSGPMSVAAAHAKKVLQGLGVDTARMVLADGSGLSRLNLVQPRQLVALLAGMHKSENRKIYMDSLPVAGVDGTLRRRFKGENPARGRVIAKTGYVSRTVALSGYIPRREQAPLAFSILVNDFVGPSSKIKQLVDDFVGRICVLAGP